MKTKFFVCLLVLAFGVNSAVADGIWTTLDMPGANCTRAYGIDDGDIVGVYEDSSSRWHSFFYNGTTWVTIDMPSADQTCAYGIDEGNIVGYYVDNQNYSVHGFTYDGATWTTLNFPEAQYTRIQSISGDNIVGRYTDSVGIEHGFIYTIPEPSTIILLISGLIVGGFFLRRRK